MYKYLIILLSLIVFVPACSLARYPFGHKQKLDPKNTEMVISWLASKPREDILKYPEVARYLKEHKVYVSLTTSPLRIHYLPNVFRTLDLTHVEGIILSLPKHYGRDQSLYEIPTEVENYPKVHINRIARDFGPITKLVPAVDFIKAANLERRSQVGGDIVIIIDDDTGYPYGMINEQIKQLASSQNTVVAGSTNALAFWKLDKTRWPDPNSDAVAEGFGSIGFKVEHIDVEAMVEVSDKQIKVAADRSCYLSDDMVISYVLARNGISRKKVFNEFMRIDNVVQFAYGFGADALHRGAGDEQLQIEKLKNTNALKYKNCYEFMMANFPAKA